MNSTGITPGKSHTEKQVVKLAGKCIHLLHPLTLSGCPFPNIWGLYLYFYMKKGRGCDIHLPGLLAEVWGGGRALQKNCLQFPLCT